jgi:ADP-ribosyl-[dinitrogen reductase] hydrolase
VSRLGAAYVQWMRQGHWSARGDVFDIGNATAMSLERLADGIPIEEAGATGEDQNGNGSLMRVLPVGLRFWRYDADEMCSHAAACSRITHAHRRSQLACGFYCLTIASVLRGLAPLDAYALAAGFTGRKMEDYSREKAAFGRLVSGSIHRLPRSEIKSSGYVIHTLEAALWCVLQHHNFSDAVLAAVNLGGDTDTTACVAGGFAGAIYGIDAIPSDWIGILPQPPRLEEMLQRFASACGADAPHST